MYNPLLGPVFLFCFTGSTGKTLYVALVLFHKNIELAVRTYKYTVTKGRNALVDIEKVASGLSCCLIML